MYFFVVHFASCTFCLYFASFYVTTHAPSYTDQEKDENINKHDNKPIKRFRDALFQKIFAFFQTDETVTFCLKATFSHLIKE